MDNPNQPNIAVQVFLSLCKWFLVILIVNNLIWAGVLIGYIHKSFGGTDYQITQEQSGTDNIQGLDNVSKTNN